MSIMIRVPAAEIRNAAGIHSVYNYEKQIGG